MDQSSSSEGEHKTLIVFIALAYFMCDGIHALSLISHDLAHVGSKTKEGR